MSHTNWDFSKKPRKVRPINEAFFIYTAFCPVNRDEVLIKVGISTIPYQRLVDVHCNSPYPIELACFAPAGDRGRARRIEKTILAQFAEFKTRGEWIKLSTDAEMKKRFSDSCNAVVKLNNGTAPKWIRIDRAQLTAYMTGKMHHIAA